MTKRLRDFLNSYAVMSSVVLLVGFPKLFTDILVIVLMCFVVRYVTQFFKR